MNQCCMYELGLIFYSNFFLSVFHYRNTICQRRLSKIILPNVPDSKQWRQKSHSSRGGGYWSSASKFISHQVLLRINFTMNGFPTMVLWELICLYSFPDRMAHAVSIPIRNSNYNAMSFLHITIKTCSFITSIEIVGTLGNDDLHRSSWFYLSLII